MMAALLVGKLELKKVATKVATKVASKVEL